MSAVKALVEDVRYTVKEIDSKESISYYSDQKFGNEKGMLLLGHPLLITDQKNQRVECSRKLLKKFQNRDDRVTEKVRQ